MSDYINYIDQELIEAGNSLFQRGDFNSAGIRYQTALNKLRQYNGDRTAPIMLASDLVKKLEVCRERTGKSFFRDLLYAPKRRTYVLSKSTYLRGIQCHKSLYLYNKVPQFRTQPSEETRKLFDQGRDFETKFKSRFEEAIDIKNLLGQDIDKYSNVTDEILQNSKEIILFEAGIIYNEILVLTDVLQKNADGSYSIYEVKLSTQMNDAIFSDLSIQYYVCKSKLINIKEFNVVLRTNDDEFNVTNYINDLEAEVETVKKNIDEFKNVLNQNREPGINMGKHCDKPYKCDYQEYCLNQKSTTNTDVGE